MSGDLIKFGVVLGLADKFSGGAKKATKNALGFDSAIAGINKEIGALNKTSKRGAAFKNLSKSFRQTQKDVDKTENKISSLQSELNKLGSGGKGFKTKLRQMKSLQTQLDKQKRRLHDNRRAISAESTALRENGVQVRHLTRDLKSLERTKNALRKQRLKRESYLQAEGRYNGFKSRYGSKIRGGAVATGVGAGLMSRSYMTKEDAQADLKMAMLKKGGRLPSAYKDISKQATTLGNKLPGSSADFYGAAASLQRQDVSADTIKNGGLKAASYLGVVSKIDPALAATIVAKSREAYGLDGGSLVDMVDITQRKQSAFGIEATDSLAAVANMAPTLNALSIGGLKDAKSIAGIEGMAAGIGLEGSEFGTALARFLDNTAEAKDKLGSRRYAYYDKLLATKGVKLDFYNKKGEFAGLENAVAQLEDMRNKLTDKEYAIVSNKLFGQRGKKIATLVGERGLKGLREAAAKMEDIASIEEKIAVKTGTLSSKFESLGGTASDFAATVFEPFTNIIKPALDWANDGIGSLNDKLSEMGSGARATTSLAFGILSIVGGIGAMKLAKFLIIRTVFSALGKTAPKAAAGMGLFGRAVAASKGGLAMLGKGLMFAAKGVLFLGRALLMNPIGLAVTAIAGAAYLIWKNWAWLKQKFTGFVDWFSGSLGSVLSAIRNGDVIGAFKAAWNSPLAWIAALPLKLSELGFNAVAGLVKGMFSYDLKAKIKELGGNMVTWLKDKLGIKSPSRVFAEAGQWIPAGIERGIDQKQKSLNKKVAGMVSPALLATGLSLPAAAGQPVSASANAHGAVVVQVDAPKIDIVINGSGHSIEQLRAMIQAEIRGAGAAIGGQIKATLMDEG